MAKDPAMGPVSKPEGGHYGDPEVVEEAAEEETMMAEYPEEAEAEVEVEAEVEEISDRSLVINLFGEKIGQLLLDGGYPSVISVLVADDEALLGTKGLGKASLKKIRELAPRQEIPEVLLPPGEPTQEDSPASVRIRRIREASQS